MTKQSGHPGRQALRSYEVSKNSTRDLFYRLVLPALAVLNLLLGLMLLSFLPPRGPIGWPVALTAAFCCLVAGWLGASAWSKSFWAVVMNRQVATWHRMSDAIFEWLADAPVPADSIERLKRSLEEARR